MQVVRRVGVLSLGKMLGLVYGCIGLLIGGVLSLLSLVGMGMSGNDSGAAIGSMIFGVGAIILVPLVYGILGFIGGLITGAVYNIVAAVAGGVEIELQ